MHVCRLGHGRQAGSAQDITYAAQAAAAKGSSVFTTVSGGQSWAAPTSLAQLLGLLATSGGGRGAAATNKTGRQTGGQARMRLVAGNTGPGVYKDWPTEQERLVDVTRVAELRALERTQVRPLAGLICSCILLMCCSVSLACGKPVALCSVLAGGACCRGGADCMTGMRRCKAIGGAALVW